MGSFRTDLSMWVTVVFDNTHTPSDKKLSEWPNINIISKLNWNPMFPPRNDHDHWRRRLEGCNMWSLWSHITHKKRRMINIFFIWKILIGKLIWLKRKSICQWFLVTERQILGPHMYYISRLYRFQNSTKMVIYTIWVRYGVYVLPKTTEQ